MAAYRKILLLLDTSDAGDQVAVAGRDLANLCGAELVALHVVEFVPVEPLGESLMPTVQVEDGLVARARERLAALAVRLGVADMRLRVEAGYAKADILRIAEEERADLIVVGSHERHGLSVLVNFTEDTVLHAAQCDVLAVRIR